MTWHYRSAQCGNAGHSKGMHINAKWLQAWINCGCCSEAPSHKVWNRISPVHLVYESRIYFLCRLFPALAADKKHLKSGNILPGTVVDTDVRKILISTVCHSTVFILIVTCRSFIQRRPVSIWPVMKASKGQLGLPTTTFSGTTTILTLTPWRDSCSTWLTSTPGAREVWAFLPLLTTLILPPPEHGRTRTFSHLDQKFNRPILVIIWMQSSAFLVPITKTTKEKFKGWKTCPWPTTSSRCITFYKTLYLSKFNMNFEFHPSLPWIFCRIEWQFERTQLYPVCPPSSWCPACRRGQCNLRKSFDWANVADAPSVDKRYLEKQHPKIANFVCLQNFTLAQPAASSFSLANFCWLKYFLKAFWRTLA